MVRTAHVGNGTGSQHHQVLSHKETQCFVEYSN